MVKKPLIAILLLSVFFITKAVQPIDHSPTSDKFIGTNTVLSTWKQKLIDEAKATNQLELANIIEQTSIIVTNEIELPSIAYAMHEGVREVVIAEEFVMAVIEFAPIFQSLLDESNGLSFMELALIDVLFHEMGHHATDSMYASYASPFMIARAEQEAEDWSYKQKSSIGIDREEIGRIISLFSIIAYQDSLLQKDKQSFEWSQAMIENHIGRACYLANSTFADTVCNTLYSMYLEDSETQKPILSAK